MFQEGMHYNNSHYKHTQFGMSNINIFQSMSYKHHSIDYKSQSHLHNKAVDIEKRKFLNKEDTHWYNLYN